MSFFVSESSASALVVRVTRLRRDGLIELEFSGDDGSISHRMLVREAAQLSDLLKEACAESEVKP